MWWMPLVQIFEFSKNESWRSSLSSLSFSLVSLLICFQRFYIPCFVENPQIIFFFFFFFWTPPPYCLFFFSFFFLHIFSKHFFPFFPYLSLCLSCNLFIIIIDAPHALFLALFFVFLRIISISFFLFFLGRKVVCSYKHSFTQHFFFLPIKCNQVFSQYDNLDKKFKVTWAN